MVINWRELLTMKNYLLTKKIRQCYLKISFNRLIPILVFFFPFYFHGCFSPLPFLPPPPFSSVRVKLTSSATCCREPCPEHAGELHGAGAGPAGQSPPLLQDKPPHTGRGAGFKHILGITNF